MLDIIIVCVMTNCERRNPYLSFRLTFLRYRESLDELLVEITRATQQVQNVLL
jgi:hypothetical protein